MYDLLHKICRTCLRSDSNAVSIYDYSIYAKPKATYVEILKDIARLEFKDDLVSANEPRQLCFNCSRHLRKAYMFVKQARESESKLSKTLEMPHEFATLVPTVVAEEQFGIKKENSDIELETNAIDEENANVGKLSPKTTFLEISISHEHCVEQEDTTLEEVQVPTNTSNFCEYSASETALENDSETVVRNEEVFDDNNKHTIVEKPVEIEVDKNISNNLDLKAPHTFSANEEDDATKTCKSLLYTCDHCPRQYYDKYDLRCHLIYKHQIDYKSHIRTKQKQKNSEKLEIKCRSCDYMANTHAALHYHTRAKHGSEEDKFTCNFCPYSNVKKFSLFVHMKKFHLSQIKSLKKIKGPTKGFTGNTISQTTIEDFAHSEDPITNNTDDNSSVCSTGDEDIIRDILNIKKRLPKAKTAENDDPYNSEDMLKTSKHLDKTRCAHCREVVGSQELLLKHIQTHHSEESLVDEGDLSQPQVSQQVYECDQCSRSYVDKKRFKIHIREKHGLEFKDFTKKYKKLAPVNKVYKCQFCEYTGNSAAAAHFHVRSKHGTEEDKIKCNFCPYTNFKKFSLLKHMKRTHLSIVRRLKEQRNSGHVSIEDLINSIPQTQEPIENETDNNKPNDCCDTSSSGDEDLIRDILKMQKRGGKANIAKTFAIRCDECGNVYKDSHALNVHKRNVHGEHCYKPCPQCHRKYKRSYDLKLHILHAHTPNYKDSKQPPKVREKRFMCTECSYICATSTLLTIHTNRHHTGEKPYKCNVCSKSFVVPFDLKTHSYLHTGERPFKCPVCSKGFRDKSHMLKHQRIHSEVKPYNCSECGKGFTKNYNLTIHKRTHMKGQKLVCGVCGKFFKDRAQLSIHQINEFHHGEAM